MTLILPILKRRLMVVAMKKKNFALAVLALSFMTACSKSGDQGDAVAKNKVDDRPLRIRLEADPPTADWNKASDNLSMEVINQVQQGLVSFDRNNKIVPALAEKWEMSKDGKTYTFHIRKTAKWSDGVPVTAQNFIDSWERLLNAKTASEYAYFIFDIVGAESYLKGEIKDFKDVGVKAVDDHTLVVKLNKAASYWESVPSFWVTSPIRKDLVEKHGDAWTKAGNLVSAGPYKLTRWERDSIVEIEANPHFWNANAYPDMPKKVQYRIVKEANVATSMFRSGDFDVVRKLPPMQIPQLAKKADSGLVGSKFFRGYYFGMKVTNPKLNQSKVRMALAMATNRKALEKVLPEMVNAQKSWIPDGMFASDTTRGIEYNPEKAKELWDSIENKPTELTYWYNQEDMNRLVAEYLQSEWKKILGLKVNLRVEEWKVYLKTVRNNSNIELFRLGWGADFPDPHNFMDLFTCASGNNQTGFCNKEYDGIIKKAATMSNGPERAALYDRAERILLEEEVAIVPLFTENNHHLISARTKGFQLNRMGYYYFKDLQTGAKAGASSAAR